MNLINHEAIGKIEPTCTKRKKRHDKRKGFLLKPGKKQHIRQIATLSYEPWIAYASLHLASDGPIGHPTTNVQFQVCLWLNFATGIRGPGKGTRRMVFLDVEHECFLGLAGEKDWFNSGHSDGDYTHTHETQLFINEKQVIKDLLEEVKKFHLEDEDNDHWSRPKPIF